MTKQPKPHPSEYAPYHTMKEFSDGINDYMEGLYWQNAGKYQGVAGQAYDRGTEYAMRVVRAANARYDAKSARFH